MVKAKDEIETGVVVAAIRRLPNHVLHPAPLPEELAGTFDITAWLNSVVKGHPYEEPNPEFLANRMALLTLSSETYEELLSDRNMPGLQELIPNTPGAGTGLINITWLYVAKSTMEQGHKCYMLFTMQSQNTGKEVTTHTSATQLQIQFAGGLAMGIWPLYGVIKRTDRKDQGGRYLFKFYTE